MPFYPKVPLTCSLCGATAPAKDWGWRQEEFPVDPEECEELKEAAVEDVAICPACGKEPGIVHINLGGLYQPLTVDRSEREE